MQILTEKLFDYAGLFPPAKLPLNEALSNYLNYQEGPYNEMLGKFILPASQCVNTVSFFNVARTPRENIIPFSILLSSSKTHSEFENSLYHDIVNIEFLANYDSKKGIISSFELSLPLECYEFPEKKLSDLFENLIKKLKLVSNVKIPFELFCEVPKLAQNQMLHFFSCVSHYNSISEHKVYAKLRTGGVTPKSIPSSETLSQFIHCLAKFHLPFKVTAGLHVPVPNFNEDVNAKMHGFLNVILAGMAAYYPISTTIHKYNDADTNSLTNIIENLNYDHLNVQNDSITMHIPSHSNNEIMFTNDMISEFRKNYFKDIGTCDFLEPIEHLGEHFS